MECPPVGIAIGCLVILMQTNPGKLAKRSLSSCSEQNGPKFEMNNVLDGVADPILTACPAVGLVARIGLACD